MSGQSPWASAGFRQYIISRGASALASSMLQALILWQVYAISGSALDLGLVGLVAFVASCASSVIGGAIVDAYDRRRVLICAGIVPGLASIGMLAAIAGALVSVPLIYALVLLTGVAGALESPAQSALLASIVPRQALTRAFTVNSASRSITSVSGPALGGILIATSGIGATYVAHLVLAALATLTLLPLRAGRGSTAGRLDAAAIREGIGFVRCQPVLLGSMTLDMFAVLFGGARALLPIYAVDILRADAVGYGLLSASIEIGTLLMALVLLVAPTAWQSGGALLGAVAAFGVATIAFGVSRWLPLSIAAYALVGMADQVSMVLRHNITQLNTPDALRGRVTGVSSVFISASNELGALESGLVAAATSPMFAVVSGGLACLVVVGLVAWWVPSLRRYQIGRPF